VVEYVTVTVSPEVTTLAVAKLPSEYKVPAVLESVLTAPAPVTKKQPYTVAEPVIVKVIAVAVAVVTFEGVVPDELAAGNTAVPRTAEPPTV
jgi:hypothetical protein